ncbi:hypothetical protein ACF0H5_009763 [Mactra antiquata]
MDYLNYLACFGIMINIFVGNVAAKEYVTVGQSMEVKATPDKLVDVTQSVNVELYCTGSRSDLGYYMKNLVEWSFIDSDGNELQLTEGFHPAKQAKELLFGPSGRYTLTWNTVNNGYGFNIRINAVTHSDNGIFRCSLVDEKRRKLDSKDVTLTVVNPVLGVSLEIHDMDHNVIAQSDVPLNVNLTPISIPPGQYKIKCASYGSNPAPTMEVWHNGNILSSSVVATKGKMNNRVSYNGTISIMSQDILPHTSVQTITCSANIPGGYYPTIQSGLTVMVR